VSAPGSLERRWAGWLLAISIAVWQLWGTGFSFFPILPDLPRILHLWWSGQVFPSSDLRPVFATDDPNWKMLPSIFGFLLTATLAWRMLHWREPERGTFLRRGVLWFLVLALCNRVVWFGFHVLWSEVDPGMFLASQLSFGLGTPALLLAIAGYGCGRRWAWYPSAALAVLLVVQTLTGHFMLEPAQWFSNLWRQLEVSTQQDPLGLLVRYSLFLTQAALLAYLFLAYLAIKLYSNPGEKAAES